MLFSRRAVGAMRGSHVLQQPGRIGLLLPAVSRVLSPLHTIFAEDQMLEEEWIRALAFAALASVLWLMGGATFAFQASQMKGLQRTSKLGAN